MSFPRPTVRLFKHAKIDDMVPLVSDWDWRYERFVIEGTGVQIDAVPTGPLLFGGRSRRARN